MTRSRISLKRALLLSAVVAVTMLSTTAYAATTTTTGGKTTTATQKTTSAAGKTTTTATSASKTTENQKSSAAKTDETSASEATTGQQTTVITATGSTQTESTGTMPSATTASSKLSLPTLSSTSTAVPTYPAPSVPPTENAPFMQHSNLPDGTVFIAVGAILGGFGAALLIWRAVVAYLLHRSIARAALAQHAANDKAPFGAPTAPFYKYKDRDSSLNVGGIGGAGGIAGSGRGVRRTNRGPTPSATPSQTNLFFSPTAPGASGLGGGNRDSRLLPSGFYAAGSASPAGAASHGQSISMSNLRPESLVTSRTIGPSPPDSPNFGPIRAMPGNPNMSGSSVSLNRPASGRAPSAYLDDMLDEQPHLFPPGAGPSRNHPYSH